MQLPKKTDTRLCKKKRFNFLEQQAHSIILFQLFQFSKFYFGTHNTTNIYGKLNVLRGFSNQSASLNIGQNIVGISQSN